MEYIEGMTLHRVVRISRHVGVVLPEGIIAEIGRQFVMDFITHTAPARLRGAFGTCSP